MVFSSLLFVYLFLPCCLLFYFLFKDIRARNAILLVFSLIFYAWTNPKYIVLLVTMVFINWGCAIGIDSNGRKRVRKHWLVIDLIGCLTILGIFKYLGFASTILQNFTGFPKDIIEIALPIGISFYTFQLISYVADVYNKKVEANKSYSRVLLYAGLFHQCIAGPIVRYETVANEIEDRNPNQNDVFIGIKRFSIGLAKKAVLANSIAKLADTFLPTSMDTLKGQTCLGLWFGAICYTIWIYLDFSAY